jgi:hypothetical protein
MNLRCLIVSYDWRALPDGPHPCQLLLHSSLSWLIAKIPDSFYYALTVLNRQPGRDGKALYSNCVGTPLVSEPRRYKVLHGGRGGIKSCEA